MAINSVSPGAAPVVRTPATSSTSAAATATPAASTPGYKEGSSYTANSSQAATGLSWGQEESANTSKACDILGKIDSPDAKKLKELLGAASMTRDEVQDASKLLEKLEGKLSPEDAAVVVRSLNYGSCLSGCMAFSKLMMENIMEDLKKTLKL